MPLQLDLLDEPLAAGGGTVAGTPLKLAVESIEEDPNQPRCEFDPETLRELAETVAERGVREPISVRPHPNEAGRWVINSGARRLRAAKLAGRAEIPAFVDLTADSYDQVIENEQRDNLTAMELAKFVERRLALGETQTEIARRLGKSQSYVAFACALIDAPEWLTALYRESKCRGMRELYELRRLHGQSPQHVREWVEQKGCITRTDVQELKADLSARRIGPEALEPIAGRVPSDFESDEGARASDSPSRPANIARRTVQRSTLLAKHEGVVVEIVLEVVPEVQGHVFIQARATRHRTCVVAGDLELVGFAGPGAIDGQ